MVQASRVAVWTATPGAAQQPPPPPGTHHTLVVACATGRLTLIQIPVRLTVVVPAVIHDVFGVEHSGSLLARVESQDAPRPRGDPPRIDAERPDLPPVPHADHRMLGRVVPVGGNVVAHVGLFSQPEVEQDRAPFGGAG